MTDGELQELLDEVARNLGIVGAQLAIYCETRVRQFASGYRNLELKLPVTHDTLFQIGSTGKLFNAALVLSLVDDKLLDLDKPVKSYMRDFRLADKDAQDSVSLRHLLSMCGGLDNGPYFDFGRGDDALGRYIHVLAGIPHVFPSGSAYGYSNASTNIAGHVAAQVAGEVWEKLIFTRIFKPLQLTQTANFAEDLLLHPVALGYKRDATRERLHRSPIWSLPRSLGPAGGLTCSSAGDLIALGRMFLNGGRSAQGLQVISETAVDSMHQPQVKMPTRFFADEWCLGPYRKKWDGTSLYGHSGTNASGSSTLMWCPTKKFAIATLSNVADQGYLLANALFDVVFPRLFGINKPSASSPRTVTPARADVRPFIGRFEAFGMIQVLEVANDRLLLTSRTCSSPESDVTNCELIPLGEGRFLPCDLRVSGNRNWDIAFWGHDSGGRATHMLQGIFPLRRTG